MSAGPADAVALRLGSIPARIPSPLDDILLALHADAMAGSTAAECWLFPADTQVGPSVASGDAQTARSRHPARRHRSTALVEPAPELPAEIAQRG